MPCSRTTARIPRSRILSHLVLAGVVGLVAAGLVAPSQGAGSGEAAVPRIVFPLIAKTALWDNYGDPRGNGQHAGIDMENPWHAPVVAAEAGRVEYSVSGLGGCMLYLYGRSGTMYMYIHLNNDAGPRNDNTGRCVNGTAYAVPDGAAVLAGQQIAYNGDSGDANGNPHLHFEVHPNGGADTNPFPHLKRATRLLFSAREGSFFSLALRGRVLSVAGETLQLSATSVRSYPGGRWLPIEPRTVEIAVPADAKLSSRLPRAAGGGQPLVASLAKEQRIAVHTAKARVTQAALAGAPGALTASRVSSLSP
jgi:murein DD-endopeptidase MepM/ murein hydrolase activator NlpD